MHSAKYTPKADPCRHGFRQPDRNSPPVLGARRRAPGSVGRHQNRARPPGRNDLLNRALRQRDRGKVAQGGTGRGEHPLSYRIRWSRKESELREVLGGAGAAKLAALDAAAQLVTVAAGGAAAGTASPFIQRPLEELARYRTGPPFPAKSDSRLAHNRAAWRAIDAAVAAVPEIQFESRTCGI